MAIDIETILEGWRARGFTGGEWTDPPGRDWEGYVHLHDELFMVIEGAVELEVAGIARRPPPGEEILIPAYTTHSVRNRDDSATRWLYAYLEK